ncbi:DUF6735 family protein [Halorhabdus salina]|uniref:DUF6735 family protein n=1 Tax=Halorhabdus salina TaxID=2750670 RepID=UPI0015EF7BDC|nr:DUF6735 family protein [Halorhabdus salina]
MSDRALVAVATDNGWNCTETKWVEDREKPPNGWRSTDDGGCPVDSFRAVVESLDFAHFEGVYRWSGGEWTPFLACWLALEPMIDERAADPRGDGVVVAIRSASDGATLRSWCRAAKRSVADAVRAGELSRACARRRLLAGIDRRVRDREQVIGRRPCG